MRSSRASRSGLLLVIALAVGAIVQGGAATAASYPVVPPLSTNGNPPTCKIADKTTKFTRTSDWSRTLVDWTLRAGSTYKPPSLVAVSRAGLAGAGYVRSELIPDLK